MIALIKGYWALPIVIFIFVTGIYLTFKLKGVQFKYLKKALKLMFSKDKEGTGEVSSFGALCISLSATIGTGNIIGVATAIAIGGSGALIWMIIASIFGLAVKYAEGYLAIKYRFIRDKETLGGPYAYIELGMGEKYKPLAKIFALFGAVASISGIGTMTQSNGISEAFCDCITGGITFTILGKEISIVAIIVGFIITTLTALVLVGGIKRISKVCEFVVPFMAILYISLALLIVIVNIQNVPGAILQMFKSAFNFKSGLGGAAGYSVMTAITSGVQKGIFANEAGLGSTPIALSSAKEDNPVREGLISMGGMIITVLICFLTGLVVCSTDAFTLGLEGIHITNYAFREGLFFKEIISSWLLVFCVTFFAFTTIIGWNLYGMKCLSYLTTNKAIHKTYLLFYIISVFLGTYLKIGFIWTFADVTNSFMALPNLIALFALSKKVELPTKDNL